MQQFDETCRTAWDARVLGLGVLLATLSLGIWIAVDGGGPIWTWLILGAFGLLSGVATVHNFGDHWHVTDAGLTYRNTITAKLGFPRERHLPWSKVMRASDYEGKTWFLTVEGEKRWVLDHLAEHDRLGLIFQQLDISVSSIEKPRPWRRDGRDADAPR